MKYLKKYNESFDITDDINGLLVELNDINFKYDIYSTYNSIHITKDNSYTFMIGEIFDIIKTLESYLLAKGLKFSYTCYCYSDDDLFEDGVDEKEFAYDEVESIETEYEIIDLHIHIE